MCRVHTFEDVKVRCDRLFFFERIDEVVKPKNMLFMLFLIKAKKVIYSMVQWCSSESPMEMKSSKFVGYGRSPRTIHFSRLGWHCLTPVVAVWEVRISFSGLI